MTMATPTYICVVCNEDINKGQECQLPATAFLYHEKCTPLEFQELRQLRARVASLEKALHSLADAYENNLPEIDCGGDEHLDEARALLMEKEDER